MAIGSELIEAMRRRRSLSLMTFNLLAPCYFRHGGRLESDYSTSFLARAQAAISAIKREKCDVICLQEFWFDHDYQCAFRQAFQRTHQIHTVKRPGDKQDGLAIFVDKSKLEVHNVESVDLVEEAGDRVALLLHVATKWNRKIVPLSQRSLLIVNSHLTFPHSDMYTSLRLNEINRVLLAMRKYVARKELFNMPVLLCGDFNDYNDPVYRLVTNHKFYSIFAHLHGREARITHCNHNNSEVSVDFIFSNRIKIGQEIKGDGIVRDNSILHLQPVDCHLVPRQLPDVARLKRPQFGHDWHSVQSPTLLREERDLVDYWRMVSDHRPLVAKFDMTERFKETSRN
ncbi:putative endonuclease/exonuclease/phosphatase [Plasmopara halstedii]